MVQYFISKGWLMMKIVIAPDTFKGSLSAAHACQAIAVGLRRVAPDAQIINIPMADGGEGTVDALVASTNGRLRQVEVRGPLSEPVTATYGILGPQPCQNVSDRSDPVQNDSSQHSVGRAAPARRSAEPDNNESDAATAVIEISAAAGLTLIPPQKRNPLHTTTFGVGQIILDALDHNCRNFIIGIGGSATTDCGTGMAQALGVKFLDQASRPISEPMTGKRMGLTASLDSSQIDPRVAQSPFIVACDVENPLLGPTGASHVYAPQKGASAEDVAILETNMTHIIGLIETMVGRSVRDLPGAGAAGGLGAGLTAFLNARLERGIEIVMRYCHFAEKIHGAAVIFTGEGRIDGQTAYGKTIAGVAAAARSQNIPVIALSGSVGPEAQKVLDIGVSAFFSICPGPISLEQAMQKAPELLADTAEQALRLVLLKNPRD
jgi:glycerate kinase